MIALLKKADMFGVPFSFKTFGDDKFTTPLGGCLTSITITIIGVCTYLFGTDFFHRENPNVIPNELTHITSKRIELTNEKYNFMFNMMRDGVPIDLNTLPYKLFGGYFHFTRDKQGVSKIKCNAYAKEVITKCSNTKATVNPDMAKVKLEDWYCMDFERVKNVCREQIVPSEPDYQPFLGGGFDEDEYTFIRFDVTNYIFDHDKQGYTNVASKESAIKQGISGLKVRYPSVGYNSSLPGNPLEVFYETQGLIINPLSYRRDVRNMTLVTNIDDNGWVFPQRTTTSALTLDKNDTETVPVTYFNDLALFYVGLFMHDKKEKLYKRSFMKLQALAAEVGGVLKSVVATFAFFAVMKAIKERDELLRSRFYKIKNKANAIDSEILLQHEPSKMNTIVATKAREDTTSGSFFSFACLFNHCKKNGEKEMHDRVHDQMNKHMYEKMDVAFLMKSFEEFATLKDMVLSEEQKEFLEGNKTEIQVDL